jgi:hypothetical protein
VYVLTANNLVLPSGTSSVQPFLVAEVLGHDEHTSSGHRELEAAKASKMINFYKVFALNATIPGDNILRLSIKSQNSLLLGGGSTEIGHTTIDLEDRWLALGRREMRSVSNAQFIADHVSMFDDEKKNGRKRFHCSRQRPLAGASEEGGGGEKRQKTREPENQDISITSKIPNS